jgi:hexokinase
MQHETLLEITHAILTELHQKNKASTTSLSYTPHVISGGTTHKEGSLFQVIVVGGTFYKCALFEVKNGQPHLKETHDGVLEVLETDMVLLNFIEKQIHPSIEYLAINFAFPMSPIVNDAGLPDGILQRESKEHKLKGLEGLPVGQRIAEHLNAKRGQQIKVATANDTICLLLSGLQNQQEKQSLAAGIVGTGVNFAYFENDHTAVNTEGGNFSAFPQPKELLLVDHATSSPGAALFEKAVSGAYLYKLFNERVASIDPQAHPISDTRELDDIARCHDLQRAPIAQEILTRSAQLCACMMAALALYKQRDLTFVMEGSVFWRAWNYQDIVNETVQELSPTYAVRPVRISESNLLGAAALLM